MGAIPIISTRWNGGSSIDFPMSLLRSESDSSSTDPSISTNTTTTSMNTADSMNTIVSDDAITTIPSTTSVANSNSMLTSNRGSTGAGAGGVYKVDHQNIAAVNIMIRTLLSNYDRDISKQQLRHQEFFHYIFSMKRKLQHVSAYYYDHLHIFF